MHLFIRVPFLLSRLCMLIWCRKQSEPPATVQQSVTLLLPYVDGINCVDLNNLVDHVQGGHFKPYEYGLHALQATVNRLLVSSIGASSTR